MTKDNVPAIEGGKATRKNFLVFGKPDIRQAEINEVVDSMKAAWIGTGPKVARFQQLVADYLGAKHTMAVNSATAGLHLSLLSCGVESGDEVITCPMTFAATANVIEHIGAKPVFVDCQKDSMNIDPKQIEKKITRKTKVILPIHMAGRPCDMDSIGKIAMNYKLKVVEDAAHAFGAEYHKQKIGTISDLTAFSFYATKNLVTGEGGMVTTSNDEYADFIRVNSLHGMSKDAWKRYSDEGFKHYLIEYPGYKYNMMDMQAAIGIHQLKRFNSGQERRKEIWSIYNKAFRNLPLTTPMDPEHNTVHGYHLYTILIDTKKVKASRDQVQAALHAENIGIGIHFIALHLHPFYKNKYGYKRGDFPNSEYISDRTISIPLGSNLSKGDVNDVIAAVTKVVNYYTSHSPLPQKVHLPKAAKDSKE